MHPRRRLDISWFDLAFGFGSAIFAPRTPPRRQSLIDAIKNLWHDPKQIGVFLSIRTSLDLLLQALKLPAGSEVIMSAVTISGMIEIVQAHGLVPVALDLNSATLAPNIDAFKKCITTRTKAVIIAPLFGSRFDLSQIAEVTKQHGIILIEDCAQSFTGFDYQGHPETDVVMFSFGPIKTATALGGAVVRIRDQALLEKMTEIEAQFKELGSWFFFKRVFKFSILKLISYPAIYGWAIACLNCFGKNYDQVLGRAVRGFSGIDLLNNIRKRPSTGLLNLMYHRLRHFNVERIRRRSKQGQGVLEQISAVVTAPGISAELRTFWVFPINCNDPDRLVAELGRNGFDATRGASNMCVVPQVRGVGSEPKGAMQFMSNIVYLPVYPELPPAELDRLKTIVKLHGSHQGDSLEPESEAKAEGRLNPDERVISAQSY